MPPTRAPSTTPVRQAPKQRTPRPLATPGGQRVSLGGRGAGVTNTVRELRSEVRKVVWPTRRETLMTGLMVVIMTSILAIFFFGVDSAFSALVRALLGLLS